jgi:transcriptional regulator with XRE-family HTH domain
MEIYHMKSDLKDIEKKYLGKLIDRIVTLRKERGMSQEKLAIESEIARSLMRGYERKERNISFANLVRIIKFGFNMTIEEFFGEGFDSVADKKKKKSKL